MARIRTIKPTLWESEKLGRLSLLARLSFVGLISLADDEGRGRGNTRYLLGHIHAYADTISEQDFTSCLMELEAAKLVAFYTIEGARYYALPGWDEHQSINKPSPSVLPPVPDTHPSAGLFRERSGRTPVELPVGREGKGREGNGMEGKGEGASASMPNLKGLPCPDLRMPWGESRGVPVMDLEPSYCDWLLKNKLAAVKATPGLETALRGRVQAKKSEMTPEQRRRAA